MFAYTIDFVDIATGWTEQRAVWGKGEAGVLEQIKDVEQSLPFPLLGFDSDNGSEFLHNFFCPSVKLVSKQRVSKQRVASKTIKCYDAPTLQRVLESEHVPEPTKHRLKEQLHNINPFELRNAMEKKLKTIYNLCSESKA